MKELGFDTMTLTVDDGKEVECGVVTLLEMHGKEYIALSPLDENEEFTEDVWLYGFQKDPSGGEDHKLIYIEDEEEYEEIADQFDEWLDLCEFEED